MTSKPLPTTNNGNLPAIAVRDCSVGFGKNVILDNVSFDVQQGQVAAIIGPNGSGKTTLMRAIIGLLPLRAGEIRIFGKHFHAVRDHVGYVPQRFDFDRNFPITVGEFLELARHRHCPKDRVVTKIREVGLSPDIVMARLGTLSGGQLQRVLVAQAILNEPQILLMDEPTSGVDIAGEATLNDIIQHLNKKHGTTVLLVSHDIAMVSALVDNVICVNRQLLCYGPPRDALTAVKINELFGPQSAFYEHRHEHPVGQPYDHGHDHA
ncbi:MAG: metal ABC transporter ATP-binding protein [Patescibacteria group bacterium]|nr:metal ABC transporter ATP-binding protein [Patescibacteria group bacterium]